MKFPIIYPGGKADQVAAPVNNYANERLTELSPQQRCDAFIQFASEVMLARCELTSEDQAADAALRLCEELGQQPVVLSGDSRLTGKAFEI